MNSSYNILILKTAFKGKMYCWHNEIDWLCKQVFLNQQSLKLVFVFIILVKYWKIQALFNKLLFPEWLTKLMMLWTERSHLMFLMVVEHLESVNLPAP